MYIEIAYFSVTMFLALAMLINWKRRRDLVAARLNRGLCGYMAARDAVRLAVPEQTSGENPIPA